MTGDPTAKVAGHAGSGVGAMEGMPASARDSQGKNKEVWPAAIRMGHFSLVVCNGFAIVTALFNS